MKKLVFALFLALQAPAYSPNEIVNAIAAVAQNEGVKPEILYTIVKIESDFEPYTISFLTNKRRLFRRSAQSKYPHQNEQLQPKFQQMGRYDHTGKRNLRRADRQVSARGRL